MRQDLGRFKFGAHQFLCKSDWTDADHGILDAVRRLGCSLFEVSLGDDVQFDLKRARRHTEALRIELTVGPGNLWPQVCNISADEPHHRQLGLAWHKKILEQAAELGAVTYCAAMYGHPGHVCRRPPPADELPGTAEDLRTLPNSLIASGFRWWSMSRFRIHLVNTAAEAVSLVQMADHPNLRVNLDTYHMITEERDYGAAIRRVSPLLATKRMAWMMAFRVLRGRDVPYLGTPLDPQLHKPNR